MNIFNLCKKITMVLILLNILTIAACTTTSPSQFYLLTPIKETPATSVPDAENLHIIGVGPIKFPRYLNRSPIVRYSSNNEVLVDEFNRWAEPLEQNFSRVLRTNLTRLVTSSYAMEYPWKREMKVRYQVMLEVHQFETQADGTVSLNAHWAILNLAKNKKVELVRKFSYGQKLDTIDYENIVAQQSKALEELSRAIAEEVQKLPF